MFRKTTLLAAALFCLLLCSCSNAPEEVPAAPVAPPPAQSVHMPEAEVPAPEPELPPELPEAEVTPTPEPPKEEPPAEKPTPEPPKEEPPAETPTSEPAEEETSPVVPNSEPPKEETPAEPPKEETPPPCQHTNTVSGTGLAPTCTTGGQNRLLCADCNQELSSSELPALGHDYQQTAVVDAVCETPGSRTLTCSRCGDVKTEEIPAPGHDWSASSCDSTAACKVCNAASTAAPGHSWVVKYAMGTPECERCATKYTFPELSIVQNVLDVPFLVGTKSITLFDFSVRLSAFEGPFTANSPCRVDISVDGVASNACTMTRSTHLLAADGTKITSIYDNHGTTNPICDGSFTEMFSFDLPTSSGSYTFVFSAQ